MGPDADAAGHENSEMADAEDAAVLADAGGALRPCHDGVERRLSGVGEGGPRTRKPHERAPGCNAVARRTRQSSTNR